MKIIEYETRWVRGKPPKQIQGCFADLVLDIPYLMTFGVIPPMNVLNEVFRNGRKCIMGSGTLWNDFEITDAEYDELVDTLMKLNMSVERKYHPYISFKQVIFDEKLSGKYFEPPTDAQLREERMEYFIGDRDFYPVRTSHYWQRKVAKRFRWNLSLEPM